MKTLTYLIFLGLSLTAFGQKNTQLIQLSGVVVTEEAIPLPYSTAYILNILRFLDAIMADEKKS